MTIYFYEISKIIIHDIHNDKEIEIEYLRLIFYCVNIYKSSFTLFPKRDVMVPRAWRHGTPSEMLRFPRVLGL